jgi:type VI protein secretion system component VasF
MLSVSRLDARLMRTRTMLWIVAAAALCLAAFLFGRVSRSHDIVSYSVNGFPTSFNRAWPTYGLPLAEDHALLVMLRAGHSTNAISHLEAMLDAATYDAMCRRQLLRGQESETLDKVLAKVVRYREQFPRAIDASTNGFGNPQQLQQYEGWVAEQKQIDAFLRDFAKH